MTTHVGYVVAIDDMAGHGVLEASVLSCGDFAGCLQYNFECAQTIPSIGERVVFCNDVQGLVSDFVKPGNI